MKVAVPKERRPYEKRVAVSPETVKKLVGLGAEVRVEQGAGLDAAFPDAEFEAAGAVIAADAQSTIDDAEVVFKVRRPITAAEEGPDELSLLKSGQILIAMLDPLMNREAMAEIAEAGICAFAMELMPRITRAQSMDVLSSQANLAGYKAVIDACEEFGRALPMMMTAAGTIAPARVFVMGAGVAGLQAIATARRLGAIVSATDVRPAAKEQVESLGADFVMVEDVESAQAETEGGYAREMSAEYQKKQAELVAETIRRQDIVICTALIPGRPAPTLVDETMVRSMKPGSIVVDLAVENGGNCTLSKGGEIVDVDGVKIVAHLNVPSRLAIDASTLYAKNLLNFVSPFVDKETSEFVVDWEDELVLGTLVTREGRVVHPMLAGEGS
ncbi:MAG: Re/Si-specific NAD(P)(+) transhydrogenase subunit alpha [Alphaproteobacteria bacterium]|jgi:NAD(P) transhydrogenase subunit alpha|nr:Re/Si-specific NAD(P)(+) transhydrogenase subunit alpha [Alphaproteobacteria bacterium]